MTAEARNALMGIDKSIFQLQEAMEELEDLADGHTLIRIKRQTDSFRRIIDDIKDTSNILEMIIREEGL